MTTQYTPNFGLALPDFRQGPWHDLLNGDLSKLDSILYAALSSVDTPLWTNSTAFTVGLTALDPVAGTTWMCLVNHTSAATGTFAADRTLHPTYWTQLLAGFAPRGEWAHNTQYFPYDLAYQSSKGIFALCKTKHISNAAGTIQDDAAMWSYLVDFSSIGAAAAIAISYTPPTGLTATNVQAAIDQVEGQVRSLDSVNITQGNQITTLQNTTGTQTTRLNALEATDLTHTSQITNLQNTDTSLQGQITTKAADSNVIHKSGDQMTGVLISKPSNTIASTDAQSFEVRGNNATNAAMTFHIPSVFASNFGLANDGNFWFGGYSHGATAYRLWSTRDFGSQPVVNMRMAFAADRVYGNGAALDEPYGGAVLTGVSGPAAFAGGTTYRYRYVQFQVGASWLTAGYV